MLAIPGGESMNFMAKAAVESSCGWMVELVEATVFDCFGLVFRIGLNIAIICGFTVGNSCLDYIELTFSEG